MDRVDELQTEPIVRRWYLVPCVFAIFDEIGDKFESRLSSEWIPIIGPLHNDKEIIRLNEDHYHYDMRFLCSRRIDQLRELYAQGFPTGPLPIVVAMIHVLNEAIVHSQIKHQPMRCLREMPEMPHVHPLSGREAPWFRKLEKHYSSSKVNCSKCPHRGFPLNGLPAENGVVICPGHGLAWDSATGNQVLRTAISSEV